jgi:hypothetical protein
MCWLCWSRHGATGPVCAFRARALPPRANDIAPHTQGQMQIDGSLLPSRSAKRQNLQSRRNRQLCGRGPRDCVRSPRGVAEAESLLSVALGTSRTEPEMGDRGRSPERGPGGGDDRERDRGYGGAPPPAGDGGGGGYGGPPPPAEGGEPAKLYIGNISYSVRHASLSARGTARRGALACLLCSAAGPSNRPNSCRFSSHSWLVRAMTDHQG